MTREDAIEILIRVANNTEDDWDQAKLYDVVEYLKRPLGDRLIDVLREVRGEK